jgi:hypothetical protein
MSYRYMHVKRYKRGASWPDGEARLCTACRNGKKWGDVKRVKRATVTAMLKYAGAKWKVPVSYCDDHDPTQEEE